MLGPLLFNILADLFFILNYVGIARCADDNASCVIVDDINGVITSLERVSKALFDWFENNLFKRNAGKCHLLLICSDAVKAGVSEYDLKKSECEKLRGVKPYMDLSKRPMVMHAFLNSQFNYYPLIWMCHNRTTNRKINRFHERYLRIIYNDKQSSFKMLFMLLMLCILSCSSYLGHSSW